MASLVSALWSDGSSLRSSERGKLGISIIHLADAILGVVEGLVQV